MIIIFITQKDYIIAEKEFLGGHYLDTYYTIRNASDFFGSLLDVLKETGNYTIAEKKENQILFIGEKAEIELKRYILSGGLELFLNKCNIKEPIRFPAEISYDALDIRIYINRDTNEIEGGISAKFNLYKDKKAPERRIIASYPKMNRMFMSLYIDCSYLSQFIDLSPFKDHEFDSWYEMNICDDKYIGSILQQVISTELEGNLCKLYYQGKSMELMSIIVDALKNKINTNLENRVNLKNLNNSAIVKARDIVKEHFYESLTIEDISRQVYKNTTWLKKNYKEAYGTTIRQDIILHRMNKALQLLSVEQLSVEETAKRIGYEHPGHFISTFRKHFGCTPREFTKMKKELM